MDLLTKLPDKLKHRLTVQEIQDGIFKQMSPDRKIELTAQLSSLCLELNNLNEYNKSKKITGKTSRGFR
jgi:hypothetical protein